VRIEFVMHESFATREAAHINGNLDGP